MPLKMSGESEKKNMFQWVHLDTFRCVNTYVKIETFLVVRFSEAPMKLVVLYRILRLLSHLSATAMICVLTSCSPAINSNFSDVSAGGTKAYIRGTILPLAGLLARQDPPSTILWAREAYASACDYRQIQVNLYDLDESGNPGANPIATSSLLDVEAHYEIENLIELGVDPEKVENGIGYLLTVNGCTGGEIRAPLTQLGDVNVTASMALIGMLSQGAPELRASLREFPPDEMTTLLQRLSNAISDQSSLEGAYAVLAANSALKNQFESSFGHRFVLNDLQNVQPQIVSTTWPTGAIPENSAASFFVGASHWNPQYTIRYLWKVDGAVVSTSPSYTYSPGKNAQGNHVVALYVGADNGSGGIDSQLPYYYRSKTLTVANTSPPTVPSVSLAGNVSLVSNPSLNLAMQTGAGFVHCQSFSWLAITEDYAQPPADSMFTQLCTTAGVQTIPYTLANTSDGLHLIRIWAKDASGAISSEPSVVTFFLDQSPPSATLVNGPGAFSNLNTASFSFTGSDPGGGAIGGFECRLDSDAYVTCSSPKMFSGLSAGAHTFSFRAIDSAGNTGASTSHSWTIDQSVPTVSLTSQPAVINNSASASFTFSGSDTGGGSVVSYTCQLDAGSYSECESPKNYSSLATGTHTFSVRSIDSAGNLSAASSYGWTIDTSGPTTSFNSFSPALVYAGTGTFAFSAVDTGGGTVASYDCKIDAGNYSPCTSPQTFSGLSNGSHTFSVRAIDTAGNTGNVISKNWTVDVSSTRATIDTSPDALTRLTTVQFSFSSGPDAGAVGYECAIDSFAYTACSSPKTYTSLSNGSHVFHTRPIDGDGNPGIPVSFSFTIDTAAPTVTIGSAPPSLTGTTTASIVFNGTDTGGGNVARFECSIDNGAYTACSSPHAYSGIVQGPHTIDVRAIDSAGNIGTATSVSWTVDLTGPTSTLTSIPSALTSSTSASFTFTANDTGGGSVSSIECSADNATFAACNSPIALSSLTAGAHTFRVRAIDTAGNIGTEITHGWTIDQTAPTTTIGSGPATLTRLSTANFTFSGVDTGGGTVAGFECKVDSGAFSSCISPKSLTGLTAGAHTFYVRAIDTAGNVGTDVSSSWGIDSTAPTTTLTSTPATYVNTTNASIGFTATDTGGGTVTGFECKIDSGAYVACTSPYSYTGLTDGLHTVSVRAIDSADNTGTAAVSSWTVDTVAPVIAITVPSALRGAQTSSVNWTVTETNASSGHSFVVEFYNGTAWMNIGSVTSTTGSLNAQAFSLASYSVPVGDSNAAKLRVSFVDRAGNTAVQTSGSFSLDSTAPTVSSFTLAGGSSTTALPSISVAIAATDPVAGGTSSAITHMQLSESSSPVSGGWLSYSSSTSFSLSATSDAKTVYVWVRDSVGNVSSARTANINLDFGTPPVITLQSPVASQNYTPGQVVPIEWRCESAQGLATDAIPYIRYTIDDGSTFFDIATNLTNNQGGGLSGSYNWTVPSTTPTGTSMTGKPFRILVGCKSAAGVVKSAYSQMVSTGGWSVFMGDPTYNQKNVNASIANVTTNASTRGSITGDAEGNIYYRKASAIMKIDRLTGYVTEFAGKQEVAGCTATANASASAAGTDGLTFPEILGMNADGTIMYVYSLGCTNLLSIRTSDAMVLEVRNLASYAIASPNHFLAGNRYLIFFTSVVNARLYRLDLQTSGSTPVLIHGDGSNLSSNPPLGSEATSIGSATGSGNHFLLFADATASKIWIAGSRHYRLDYSSSSGTYIVGRTGIPYSDTNEPRFCRGTQFDNKIYCAPRHVGRNISIYDLATESFLTPSSVPFDNNDSSGFLAIGANSTRLLVHYSLNTINVVDAAAMPSSSAYTLYAGNSLATMGNGNDPALVGFGDLIDIAYDSNTGKLMVSIGGHQRTINMSSTPYVTSTRWYAMTTDSKMRVGFNPDFSAFVTGSSCAANLGLTKFIVGTSTISDVITWFCTTVQPGYPLATGASISGAGLYISGGRGGRSSSVMYDSDNFPAVTSNGNTYFAAKNGNNDAFIYSSNGSTLTRIAGTTGTATYSASDHGKSALGASLFNVKIVRVIPSGTYAGDLMIWDGNFLRRISIASQTAGTACPVAGTAPCIYDVVDYRTATGFAAGTTFQDAIYDFSTEISGVFGSGITYYVNGSSVVRKFVPTAVTNGTVSAATDTAYSFTGTSLSGEVRLALTPAGLLITQPTKQRILRVAP